MDKFLELIITYMLSAILVYVASIGVELDIKYKLIIQLIIAIIFLILILML